MATNRPPPKHGRPPINEELPPGRCSPSGSGEDETDTCGMAIQTLQQQQQQQQQQEQQHDQRTNSSHDRCSLALPASPTTTTTAAAAVPSGRRPTIASTMLLLCLTAGCLAALIIVVASPNSSGHSGSSGSGNVGSAPGSAGEIEIVSRVSLGRVRKMSFRGTTVGGVSGLLGAYDTAGGIAKRRGLEGQDQGEHHGHHGDVSAEDEYKDEEDVEVSAELAGTDENEDESVIAARDPTGSEPEPTLYDPSPNDDEAPPSDLELDTMKTIESTSTEEYAFRIQEMEERLRTAMTARGPLLDFDVNATKQFAHLHHMKTGGTSINRLINCALGRARDMHQAYTAAAAEAAEAEAAQATPPSRRREHLLPFYSLEECSQRRYRSCLNDNTTSAQSCRSSIETASVMQYCAPLHQMARFQWLQADIVTVLRHPVDRVWSMFRFQTKNCFKCTPLVDIYRHIDDGTLDEFCGDRGCGGTCIPQLLNHETRNLLTDAWDENDNGGVSVSTDEEKLSEALFNLEHRVTLVGVTHELPTFAKMLGMVFPWLAENVTAQQLGLAFDHQQQQQQQQGENLTPGGDRNLRQRVAAASASSSSSTEPRSCPLSHANASPKNNRCGPSNTHWELPDEPDEETAEAILRHNQMDLKIYEAARARFELQRRALGL